MAYRFPEILRKDPRGRKPEQGSRQTVAYRCPQWVTDGIKAIADHNGLSKSDVVNYAIHVCWDKEQANEPVMPDWSMPVGFCKWKQHPKSFATRQHIRNKLGDLYVKWNLPQSQAVVKCLVATYNLQAP